MAHDLLIFFALEFFLKKYKYTRGVTFRALLEHPGGGGCWAGAGNQGWMAGAPLGEGAGLIKLHGGQLPWSHGKRFGYKNLTNNNQIQLPRIHPISIPVHISA